MARSKFRVRVSFPLGCVVLGMALFGSANGAEPFAPTPSERVLLPEYCQDRLANKNFKKWGTVLGDGYNHIHHYCFALNFINRAKAKVRDVPGRKHALQSASNNLDYVMERTDDKYVLAPDFHIARGEIRMMQGDMVEAQLSFTRATELKPDYPKGWLALSDLFQRSNRHDQARQALEEGLRFAPEKHKDFMRKKLSELDQPKDAPLVDPPKGK